MERNKEEDPEVTDPIVITTDTGVENPDEGKFRFRKIGGGSLRFKNRIIKPNQMFKAFPDDIPVAFRDTVISVDKNVVWKKVQEEKKQEKIQEKALPPLVDIAKPIYTVQPHGKSLFLFDVFDGNGKLLNEKSLKKEVADQFVVDLLK
ncbi:MAG TPA: hypothetical protein VMX17_05300 [Candidatus Glassbacteria bacterium]|nr:hypothetical protein [Candidatus Glassbacteria bacterium]